MYRLATPIHQHVSNYNTVVVTIIHLNEPSKLSLSVMFGTEVGNRIMEIVVVSATWCINKNILVKITLEARAISDVGITFCF